MNKSSHFFFSSSPPVAKYTVDKDWFWRRWKQLNGPILFSSARGFQQPLHCRISRTALKTWDRTSMLPDGNFWGTKKHRVPARLPLSDMFGFCEMKCDAKRCRCKRVLRNLKYFWISRNKRKKRSCTVKSLKYRTVAKDDVSIQTDLQEEPFRSKRCLSVLNIAPRLYWNLLTVCKSFSFYAQPWHRQRPPIASQSH